jgi:hypothetical protein
MDKILHNIFSCCLIVFLFSSLSLAADKAEKVEEIEYYIHFEDQPDFLAEYSLKSMHFLNTPAERVTTTSITIKGNMIFNTHDFELTSIKDVFEYTIIEHRDSGESFCEPSYQKIDLKKNTMFVERGRRKQEISFLQYRDPRGECPSGLLFVFSTENRQIEVEAFLRRRPVVESTSGN